MAGSGPKRARPLGASPFPIVEGLYRLTETWALTLPGPFRRRLEDGDMVLWRPGLTFWIAVWGPPPRPTLRPLDARLAWILEDANPARERERLVHDQGLARLTYELDERDARTDSAFVRSVSGYVLAEDGHVQISGYCDDEEAVAIAHQVIGSVHQIRS